MKSNTAQRNADIASTFFIGNIATVLASASVIIGQKFVSQASLEGTMIMDVVSSTAIAAAVLSAMSIPIAALTADKADDVSSHEAQPEKTRKKSYLGQAFVMATALAISSVTGVAAKQLVNMNKGAEHSSGTKSAPSHKPSHH